jgi:hypothetical protein
MSTDPKNIRIDYVLIDRQYRAPLGNEISKILSESPVPTYFLKVEIDILGLL